MFLWLWLGYCCLLLWLSYRIELLSHHLEKSGQRIWVLPVGVLTACFFVCLSAWGIIKFKGLPERVDPIVVKLASEKENMSRGKQDCIYGKVHARGPLSCSYGKGDVKAVVLGDSHAAALVTAVQAALSSQDKKVLLWSRAACPFIRGVTAKIDQDCNSFVDWVMEQLKTLPSNVPVVLIERSSLYAMGANEGIVGAGKIKPPV